MSKENSAPGDQKQSLPSIISAQDFTANLGDDQELALSITELFLEKHEAYLQEIKEVIDSKQDRPLMVRAHTLKGTLANFSCGAAINLAKDLEQHAGQQDFEAARAVYLELEKEIELVARAVRKLATQIQQLPS